MKIKAILILVLFCVAIPVWCTKKERNLISVTYSLETINDKLIKVTFSLNNNDSVNYFIPLIKPAYKYCDFSDEKNSEDIQWGIDPAFYLTNKILNRADLMETAELDSMYYDEKKDTVYFYFKEPFIKRYYDRILANFKNKRKLDFIYPFFYHAISNGCVYLKKNSSQNIIVYVYHYYPIKPNELKISFDFNTKTIPDFKENYFKHIPDHIEDYVLFEGQIKLNP
jgi:hypothetical protein